MPEAPRMQVSVVYAEPDRAFRVEMSLPRGASVADAIGQSGFREARPDVMVVENRLGIFGRRVAPDAKLCDGDRVEIYRPLKVDPKEARRKRARMPREPRQFT